MWASREMLKDNKDAQLYVKTTLRELFLYCIFLFIVCYMTFTQYSPLNYRYTQMMRSLFENQEDITNYKGFWKVKINIMLIFFRYVMKKIKKTNFFFIVHGGRPSRCIILGNLV